MESSYIILYAFLWLIVLFFYYYKHKKTIDAATILVSSYILYAIASYFLFTDSYYGFAYQGITLFPFIYLFFLLYIVAKPILNFDTNKIDNIQQPSLQLLDLISLFYIIMQLASLPNIISNFNILGLLYHSVDAGSELYKDTVTDSRFVASSMGVGISNLPSLFANFFSRIGVLFFFYYLTIPKKNKVIVFGLLLSIIIYILSFLLTGQRGGSFKIIVTSIITYFALKKFISKSINRKIKRIGLILMILICIPYYYLTSSRFALNKGGIESSLYLYMGQGNLNFNLYALDNNGIRYGDRVVPYFKKMVGFKNVPNNFWERRWKYPYLKINDESFCTYVGDFTIDFGPFAGGFCLLLMGLIVLWKTRIKNRTIMFHQLILLHFIMCLCMEGGMSLYSFSDSNNMVVIVYFLTYLCFKYEYIHRLKKLV